MPVLVINAPFGPNRLQILISSLSFSPFYFVFLKLNFAFFNMLAFEIVSEKLKVKIEKQKIKYKCHTQLIQQELGHLNFRELRIMRVF